MITNSVPCPQALNYLPVDWHRIKSNITRLIILKVVWNLVLLWCLWSSAAQAGPLTDRLAAFPHWQHKPSVQTAVGDLIYPAWFAGTWNVTSTLVDLAAPLAPKIVTPGFDGNRQYLNQPIHFQVRFASAPQSKPLQVVADRAFNGLNLAKAYLGDRAVLSVKTDPHSPNRQITFLRGDRQLISTITGRAVETPASEHFVTTEIFQQLFRGTDQPYFNEVETTTAYRYLASPQPTIEAEQVTAIYLSPQDANYFKAGNSPVALYRYQLELSPTESFAAGEQSRKDKNGQEIRNEQPLTP